MVTVTCIGLEPFLPCRIPNGDVCNLSLTFKIALRSFPVVKIVLKSTPIGKTKYERIANLASSHRAFGTGQGGIHFPCSFSSTTKQNSSISGAGPISECDIFSPNCCLFGGWDCYRSDEVLSQESRVSRRGQRVALRFPPSVCPVFPSGRDTPDTLPSLRDGIKLRRHAMTLRHTDYRRDGLTSNEGTKGRGGGNG